MITKMINDSYPELAPKNSKAENLIVFLHGLGSDGNDLISLCPYFEKTLDNIYFISPHGTEEFDMAPFGRQWFSLKDRSKETISKELENKYSAIEKIICSKQQSLKLTNRETIIIGFSQGTMIGSYLTLSQITPYASLIGFSGRICPPI